MCTDYDEFYCTRMAAKCFQADPHEMIPGRSTKLLLGEWTPESPMAVHWRHGSPDPGGVARGTSLGLYYLSQEVQSRLSSDAITGWSTYPIELYDKHGARVPGYAGMSVLGRCGELDLSRGRLGQPTNRKFAKHVGLHFDEASWDKSDIFCPQGSCQVIVRKRVRDLFVRHSIDGIRFVGLSEVEYRR